MLIDVNLAKNQILETQYQRIKIGIREKYTKWKLTAKDG